MKRTKETKIFAPLLSVSFSYDVKEKNAQEITCRKMEKKTDGEKVFHFLGLSFPNRFLFLFFFFFVLKRTRKFVDYIFSEDRKTGRLAPFASERENLNLPTESNSFCFSSSCPSFLGKERTAFPFGRIWQRSIKKRQFERFPIERRNRRVSV